jgi:hypothetical protein
MVRPTTQHYLAIVKLGKGVVEAIVDTGGSRCMIDLKTATKLGLPIEVATPQKHFGSFYGPNGVSTPYYGRVKGPVRIDVGPDVYLSVPDIKVVQHKDPLVLLGTDVLVNSWNDWVFHYVGIHKEKKTGIMSVVRSSDGAEVTVELSSWPAPVDESGARREEWAGIHNDRHFLHKESPPEEETKSDATSSGGKKDPAPTKSGLATIPESTEEFVGITKEVPE